MEIKIKKLTDKAVIPAYARPGDAGMDLTAVSKSVDDYGNVCYGSGLAVEIPEGYVGLVFPRSSVKRYDLLLTNSVGVIDSGYRGEITAAFVACGFGDEEYEVGDRFAQLIILPYPQITFTEVTELSETERGVGGYGSTGK